MVTMLAEHECVKYSNSLKKKKSSTRKIEYICSGRVVVLRYKYQSHSFLVLQFIFSVHIFQLQVKNQVVCVFICPALYYSYGNPR